MEININGVIWMLKKQHRDFSEWTASYFSPDGDEITLIVFNNKELELYCFSGINCSKISIDELDFSALKHKISNLNFQDTFVVQCLTIADYFCKIFCEYKPL